jgi:hypothetical protein
LVALLLLAAAFALLNGVAYMHAGLMRPMTLPAHVRTSRANGLDCR